MPLPTRLEHLLDVAEAAEERLAVGKVHRLPHLAERLALDARGMRERAADGDALAVGLGNIFAEWIVELQLPLVAEHEDRPRHERLRDRRDRVLRVRLGLEAAFHIGQTHRLRPQQFVAAEERRGRARRRALALEQD